jgi:flagellar motor switch protein FliN
LNHDGQETHKSSPKIVSFQRGYNVTEKDENNIENDARDDGGAATAGTNSSTEGDSAGREKRGDAAESADERQDSGNWNIDLLLDVELPVCVSFGQTEMPLRDVFKLGTGSVIELDKSVNDPVTVIVNNKPIAKGEVVMVDGNYGVRILEVESTADRIRSLG